VIAVLGGLGAALAFAIATLSYSRAIRFLPSTVVLGWVMLVGLAIVAPATLIFGMPANLTSQSLFWLALIGLGNFGGLLFDLAALRLGKVGIVATIVSTEGAIAAVIAVLAGEPLPIAVGLALVAVAVGIVLTTIVPGELDELERSSSRRAALLASAAAVLFAVGLFATGRVDHSIPVIWALVPARLFATLGLALPLAAQRRLRIARPAIPFILFAGLAEVVGFGSFAIGARESVAVSAVLVSQFATISVVVAWLRLGERLTPLQVSGVVLVIAGVAAVAALEA
jgi:drug/metabolite transporter (DMT)-like permease